MRIKLVEKYLKGFLTENDISSLTPLLEKAHSHIINRDGKGNEFLGWLDTPTNFDIDEHEKIKSTAKKIIENSDILLVIGIGGSYLGARAVIEMLKSPLYNNKTKDTPDIYFLGSSMSADEINDIIEICEEKRIAVNIISKSGTTTEPAIAFRIVRKIMEQKYSKDELKERVFITTDKAKGTLKEFADKMEFTTFVIPDDVGGRFSVLTAVGLLPIAVSGINIDKLIKGAADAKTAYFDAGLDNIAYRYALIRNVLYNKDKKIEILCSYQPSHRMISEWWKQLFGESEGKDGKGIFPASVIFSTDLHSMGQYIQDGERIIFETVLLQKKSKETINIPHDDSDIDGLNFISEVSLDEINNSAFLGTALAHTDGGVPNIVIEFDTCDEETVGELIFFFFLSCAASAYILDVNPFNQPGVEEYKQNMFALMGKPGFEELNIKLCNKIEELEN